MNDQQFAGDVQSAVISNQVNQRLSGAGELMKEAWSRLKKNFGTLIKLEIITWIPFIIGLSLLFIFVIPVARDVASHASNAQRQISYPLNIRDGQLNISNQPNVKTNIPFSALPISARVAVGVTWVLFIAGAFVRIAVSAGELKLLAIDTPITMGEIWAHGWRRFFPTLGHALLLLLIFTPIIIGVGLLMAGLAFVGAVIAFGGASSEAMQSIKSVAMIGGVVAIILIPTYIFLLIRLSFVMPLVAIGETNGAFKESWIIARGKFWAILWRTVAIGLLAGFISLIIRIPANLLVLSFMGNTQAQLITAIGGGIIGAIFQFLLMLYTMAYSVSLLRNLQAIKQL